MRQHEVEKVSDQFRCEVQSEGFKCRDARILKWLVRDNLYDKRFNERETILTCGNVLGLKMLVAEGYDPNYEDSANMQPLSSPHCKKETVDALLEVGAKVELLNGRRLPSAEAFRRMLQLRPKETKAKVTFYMIVLRFDQRCIFAAFR